MNRLPQPDHERAVLKAHARLALALSALDEHDRVGVKITKELQSAEAEIRALARAK